MKLHRSVAIFIFYSLLFVYPLMSFLWRRSYPLLTVETGILFFLGFIICALLSFILTKVRYKIVGIVSSLMITISFMVQFNLLLEGVVICLVVSLLLAWRFKRNFHLFSLPILIALIFGAFLDSYDYESNSQAAEQFGNANTELPPIIHILLDAFSGIDGLPPYSASSVMKNELHKFFDEYGFQVFTSAYSRYSQTGDSMYSAMNFKNDGNSEFAQEVANRRAHILKSNALFESLENAGYRINIYQTDHLDFCQSNPNNVDKCWNYLHPFVRSIRQVKSLELRVSNLAGVLLRQSTILAEMFRLRGWFDDLGVTNHDPQVFSNLKNDILNEPDGRYFFAHVLLPHGPFAYLHDCSINYEVGRNIRITFAVDEAVQEDLIYEARYGMYLEQMECALVSLRKIFDEMKKSDLFNRSIIVLHGDHGSLIGKNLANYRNFEMLTPADYKSNYSTLFAAKFPFGKFQTNSEVLSLGVLLEEFSFAVQGHATNQQAPPSKLQILTDDQTKLGMYVYLPGTQPLYRIDINIFDD